MENEPQALKPVVLLNLQLLAFIDTPGMARIRGWHCSWWISC